MNYRETGLRSCNSTFDDWSCFDLQDLALEFQDRTPVAFPDYTMKTLTQSELHQRFSPEYIQALSTFGAIAVDVVERLLAEGEIFAGTNGDRPRFSATGVRFTQKL